MKSMMFFFAICILIVSVSCSSIGTTKKFEPIAATVMLAVDKNDKLSLPPQKIILKDEAKVKQLASFFPGLGRPNPESHGASHFEGYLIIDFTGIDGRIIKVVSDFDWWEERTGEPGGNNAAGLKKYIFSLFETDRGTSDGKKSINGK